MAEFLVRVSGGKEARYCRSAVCSRLSEDDDASLVVENGFDLRFDGAAEPSHALGAECRINGTRGSEALKPEATAPGRLRDQRQSRAGFGNCDAGHREATLTFGVPSCAERLIERPIRLKPHKP
jgi:hypothetical protein